MVTLLDLCIEEVVILLQSNYWPIGHHEFESFNPFAALPSQINERLITDIVRSTRSGMLSVNEVYPMLISGRVRNFLLTFAIINYEEFISILTTLSIHGYLLIKLVLDEIQLIPSYISDQVAQPIAAAIESLLSLSPNLKFIRIGIPFDLKAIQNVEALEQLELNFPPKNGLYDIIPKFNNTCYVNNSLKFLSVIKSRYIVPAEEIAFLLEYCSELTYLGNDVSEGIKLLHESELDSGTLDKKYKLEKIVLGDIFSHPISNSVIVDIISFTCPNLKDLEILVNDHTAVVALRHCKNLESLLIQWELVTSPGDFQLSLQKILEEIGPKLNKLTIINFSNVGFELIARACPQLKYLKIEYRGLGTSSNEPSFENLESLHVDCYSDEGISIEILMQLLSSCKNITYLYLENAPSLNDAVLEQILVNNRLSNLDEAYLIDCSLSEEGLRHFVLSCLQTLKVLQFSSTNVILDDAIDIVHAINPAILIMMD